MRPTSHLLSNLPPFWFRYSYNPQMTLLDPFLLPLDMFLHHHPLDFFLSLLSHLLFPVDSELLIPCNVLQLSLL